MARPMGSDSKHCMDFYDGAVLDAGGTDETGEYPKISLRRTLP